MPLCLSPCHVRESRIFFNALHSHPDQQQGLTMRSSLYAISVIALIGILGISLLSIPSISCAESSDPISSYVPPSSLPFNFYNYLEGEWSVIEASGPLASTLEESPIQRRYSLQKQNFTGNLVGTLAINNTETGEILDHSSVLVAFSDFSNGAFLIGPQGADDAEEHKKIFEFSFYQSSNAAIPLSTGNLAAAKDGEEGLPYIIQCVSANVWTTTVLSKDQKTITVYTAKKIVPVIPKTFFQQYGTYLFIGAFFLFNMWVKSKQAMGQQARRTGQRAPNTEGGAAAATPAAAADSKKSN